MSAPVDQDHTGPASVEVRLHGGGSYEATYTGSGGISSGVAAGLMTRTDRRFEFFFAQTSDGVLLRGTGSCPIG